MKPALLIIDVQRDFYSISPATAESLDRAIEYINAAIELFRERGLPIVCIQHMNEERGLAPGAEGFELPEQLDVLSSDPRIHKRHGNAFHKTPLQDMLQELGVDTVIVTGFCAEHCVLSTHRGAYDCDLTPIILRGSLASSVPENVRFVESINDLISYGALRKMLA